MHKIIICDKIKENNEEGEDIKMIGTIKIKEKNNNEKIKGNAKTRMAVHTHTHTHTILSFRK